MTSPGPAPAATPEAVPGLAPETEPVPDAAWDAVVVGGGVAGLTAAYELVRRGARVLVLEASDALGGTVAGTTLRVPARGGAAAAAEVSLDVGAESFATRTPAVGELVRELGLDVEQPSGLGAWVYAPGTGPDPDRADVARPIPRTGTLGVPANPWAADVRQVLGFGGALRAWWDLGKARTPLPASLGQWVRERLGDAALERLVAPVAGGVHSADPETLDPRAVAPALVAAYEETGSLLRAAGRLANTRPGSAVAGVVGGMHRIVDALADAVRGPHAPLEPTGPAGFGEIRTGARVVGLENPRLRGDAEADGLWRVTVANGSGTEAGGGAEAGTTTVSAPLVVLAVPRSAAVPLLTTAAGDASGGDEAAGLAPETIGGSDVQLMTLVLDAPALDAAPRGTGVLIAPGAAVRAKGLTHSSVKWPSVRAALPAGVHAVRLSYGRAGDPEPTAVPTVEEAVADASRILGVSLTTDQVLAHATTHWPDALVPARPEDRAPLAALLTRLPGLAVTGGWVAGTGLAAVVGHARSVCPS